MRAAARVAVVRAVPLEPASSSAGGGAEGSELGGGIGEPAAGGGVACAEQDMACNGGQACGVVVAEPRHGRGCTQVRESDLGAVEGGAGGRMVADVGVSRRLDAREP